MRNGKIVHSGGNVSTYLNSDLKTKLIEDAKVKGLSVTKVVQNIIKNHYEKATAK